MQVLIVGGCGFLGIHLQRRFLKEGHDVFVVDDLPGGDQTYLEIAERNFYKMNMGEGRLEEIFRTHNLDVVIWAVDGNRLDNKPDGEMSRRCGALVWGLQLAKKYETGKFIYLSSDAAYREVGNTLTLSNAVAEACCFTWRQCNDVNLTVVRLAALYGAWQGNGNDILTDSLQSMAQNNTPILLDNAASGGDFLYVEDAVDAIYRLTQRSYDMDTLDIASGTFTTLQEIGDILQEITGRQVQYNAAPQSVFCMRMDPKRCKEELGWRQKYNLREGLEKSYRWYADQEKEKEKASAKHEGKNISRFSFLRPYIENLLFFVVVSVLTLNAPHKSVVNTEIGLDYNYIYIATMGLLYGKRQSIPAVVLSAALLLYSFAARGADLVAILYQTQHMVHLASYLFFGVIVGYVTDNKDRAYGDLESEKNRVLDRYSFLERMYLQNNEIKERLYRQIVNSDDSLGRTYKVLRRLDSIGVENLFTAANEVIAEIMGARDVAIYAFGRNQYYLRLKTHIGNWASDLPNSLKVEDFAYLQEIMSERQVFVNRNLTPGLPDMAAPILYEDRVIAVVQVYRLRFEDLNLNSQNQLKITTLLIAGALAKAYRYEEDLQDKRYIAGTQLLTAEEFDKIKVEIQVRGERYAHSSFTIFKLPGTGTDWRNIGERLGPLIRSEDFAGIGSDGAVQVIMVNLHQEAIAVVKERFAAAGFTAQVIEAHDNGK